MLVQIPQLDISSRKNFKQTNSIDLVKVIDKKS